MFEKHFDPASSNQHKHLQNFYNLNVCLRKIEEVQSPLKTPAQKFVFNILQKLCNLFAFLYINLHKS